MEHYNVIVIGGEPAVFNAAMNAAAFPHITPAPLLQPVQEGALKFLSI